MNQKSYLQERSQRLHFEILDGLDNKASVEKKASELLTLLEEYCARDYSSILEKHGRQKLQNEALTSPLSSIDWDLALFSGDGIFLYQIFTLLNNESCRKKAEALAKKEYENRIAYYEYILEGFPGGGGGDKIAAQLNMAEYLYSADIKDCALDDLSYYFEEGGFKQTIYPRTALFDYCFLSTKEYDEKLDSEIIETFHQYLDSPRNPKDFFYTSLATTGSHLTKDTHMSAMLSIQTIRLRYILRDFYPRESFSYEDQRNYRLQGILFDKVFFNETAVEARGRSTRYKYSNADWLLNYYRDSVIPSRALVKSEWIGLYLASKEIDLDLFQQLFRIITRKEKDYKKSALEAFYSMNPRTSSESSEYWTSHLLKKGSDFNVNLDKMPLTLSGAQKSLFKGLLFMSMWEKSSNSPIDEKIENKKRKKKGYIYRDPASYYDRTLHDIFIESPVEDLGIVLKEASKMLNMADEGLDYSFFDLEGEITDNSDYTLLLYFFSRIERESKPALISVLNLLRQRQLEYLPIIENDKVNEANHKKIQEIDGGFKLDYFQSTLSPLHELKFLRDVYVDNRFLYPQKTVKFICESDREYRGGGKNDVDWFLSNRKALHTIYLYKIRNQASHFAEDENISVFTEPKHLRSLLLVLIEALCMHEGHFSHMSHYKENCSWWHHLFLRCIPFYTKEHISFFIKVLCLIAGEKGHPEIASLAMECGFYKLEAYLKNQEKPVQLSSYELTEEERSSVLKKLELVESSHSHSFRAQDKPFNLAEHYLTYFEEILRDTLRFLFSSEVQNYYDRTQENSFLKTHHAESAFYMLHLAPALFNNPNITQNKE